MNFKKTLVFLSENFDDTFSFGNILKDNSEYIVYQAETYERLQKIKKEEIQIIVSDFRFSALQGLELIEKIKNDYSDIPLIVYTDCGSEEFAGDCVNAGISGYIKKSEQGFSKLLSLIQKLSNEIERKRNNRISVSKLQENQDLFQTVFENSSNAVCLVDSNGCFINVNDNLCKMLGYRKEEFFSKRFSYILHVTITIEQEKFNRMIAGFEKTISFEKTYQHKDGVPVWVQISTSIVRNSQDNSYYFVSYIENITKYKRTESELRIFSQAVEQNPASIILTDTEGNIEYTNPKFTEVSGYFAAEVFGQNPRILKSGNTSSEVYEQMWQTILSGKEWRGEFQNRKKNGEVYFENVLISPIINDEGKIVRYLAVKEDITEKQKSEQQIIKLSKAVEHSPASTIITDEKGKIEYVNLEFTLLTGYQAEDVLGKAPRIFNKGHLSHEDYKSMWDALRSGKIVKTEFLNRKKTHERYWENVSISPLINNLGIITNFILIVEDISIEKKLMHDLIVAKDKAEESDRLKTAFLHNISHEIRTPLNAIVGFSELITDNEIPAEKRTQYSEIIVQSSRQLLSIITDIISIATIEAGKEILNTSQININYLLRQIYDQFSLKVKDKNIAFTINLELYDDFAFFESDETKLNQIISNLVGNALKFTEKGTIEFGYFVKDDCLEFYVSDTGIGIPDNLQEEIFQRFRQVEMTTTRQYGGSGLGLSISKSYIELLGGKIWVKSIVGEGSEFHFTIPVKENQQKIITKNLISYSPELELKTYKTILIAEDEDYNFMYLLEILSKENIDIIRTSNGEETVKRCRENSKIDLILMDIKMPVMDGYQATKLIKEFRPELPIIAQTAYAQKSDSVKAFESGCNDYISKPINSELLIHKINLHLGREKIN